MAPPPAAPVATRNPTTASIGAHISRCIHHRCRTGWAVGACCPTGGAGVVGANGSAANRSYGSLPAGGMARWSVWS